MRFRFREVSDAREGSESWQERLGGHGQEGSKNPIGLGTVNESKVGRDNYERMQVLKTKTTTSADAMRMML